MSTTSVCVHHLASIKMERSYFDGNNAFHTLRFTAVDSDGGTFEVTFYSPEPVELTDSTKQSNAYPWGDTE